MGELGHESGALDTTARPGRGPLGLSLSLGVSPYHLATREPPAMAALLLGDRVVTLLPEPAAGTEREDVKRAIEDSPHYLRLMEAWRWTAPLWKDGVISGGFDGRTPAAELDGVYRTIGDETALASLRPLVRGADQRRTREPAKALDLLSADVLKGGPDPGINIPIAAALDRFCVREGVVPVRSGQASVVQRAESKLGQRVFAAAVPILMRAGAGRVRRAREELRVELAELRSAVCACAERATRPGAMGAMDADVGAREVVRSAEVFARAFTTWAPDNARGDDENQERVVCGYVSLTGMTMPGDAVLRSSRAAVRAMQGAGVGAGGAGTGAVAEASESGQTPPTMFVLIVREMNVRPEPA